MRAPQPWYVRVRTVTAGEWLAFMEAFAEVVLASVRVRRGALVSLRAMSRRPLQCKTIDPVRHRELIGRVIWAIDRAAKRSPFRSLCFERGFAAKRMLDRRGIASILYYGVAYDEHDAIEAHVWVIADGLDICGAAHAHRYAVLAQFPDAGTDR